MIHVENDAVVIDNPNLRVASPTGDYDDHALIDFYDIGKPGVISGSFQAQYIKYGGIIYKFNSPEELGEAILKMDAESTHSAASYVRMSKELLAQMTDGTLEIDSLQKIMAKEEVVQPKDTEGIPEIPDVPKKIKDTTTLTSPVSPIKATESRTTGVIPVINQEDSVKIIDSDETIDNITDVVDSVNKKVDAISKTAEKISDVMEKIVK